MKRFSKPLLVTAICRNKEAHVWVKIWVYLSPITVLRLNGGNWQGVVCVCAWERKYAWYMFFLSVFKWWESVVMPWHISFKINIKHPPWQPAFLKHRYLSETKRSTSFSCLYFNLDVLAKNSPSSDVTGDFCSSSLRRKSLALDECIFGLSWGWKWVYRLLKREVSLAVSEIPLRMSLAFRILPLREMKEKHTRARTYTQARL